MISLVWAKKNCAQNVHLKQSRFIYFVTVTNRLLDHFKDFN